MKEIIIDSEFQALLPPLNIETYEALEDNVIVNGCMFPLVTWKGILIDGHNRYTICTKYNIPYEVVEKEFASREDVIIWIINNQVARRNLTLMQLTYFRGLHYNTIKNRRGNKTGKNQFSEEKGNYYAFPQDLTAAESLSKQYKVSRKPIAVSEYTGTESMGVATAVDIAFAAVNSHNPLLESITGPAFKNLINTCTTGTAARSKTALRTYIDTLEGIYAGLSGLIYCD